MSAIKTPAPYTAATLASMKAEADLKQKDEATRRAAAIERMAGIPVNTVTVDGRDEDDTDSMYTVYSRKGATRLGRKRKDFVPQLAPVLMDKFEEERRERLQRSLRLLRKDPKFRDMPIREIMRNYRHLLDIPEPPTILINPNAPIRVHVREATEELAMTDPATVPGLSDEDADKALTKMMKSVAIGAGTAVAVA